MKLEKWALVAEIVGALAVVVSVLYVGFEIRQNSATLQAASFQAVSDSITDLTASIGRDSELTRIYTTGLGPESNELSAAERAQFNLLMVAMVRRLENAYFQNSQGFIPREQWDGLQKAFDFIILAPGGRRWWSDPATQALYSDSFVQFVDSLGSSGDE